MAEKVMGIARHAPLPTWSTTGTFRDWLNRTAGQRLRSDKKVVYFHGCATMYYEPFIGQAAVLVLEHNGYEVIVPEQNCCGLPMLSNGEFPAAERYHNGNVPKLAGFARAGYPIVGTSTSCTLTLKEEAPELLDLQTEGVLALKDATWDIFEFLRELQEAGELRIDFRPLEMKLPYHAPCQFRAHRVGKPALEIMALIPGLDISEARPLLRHRRHLWLQAGEVPDRHGCGRRVVQLCARAGAGGGDDRVRLGDLSLAVGARHEPAQPPSHRGAGRGVWVV
jgi:glycerol-3-phosphate dehydrogenase subunit C